MVSSDRRASMGLDRTASTMHDMDEDYDLEAMGISDGFRPAGLHNDTTPAAPTAENGLLTTSRRSQGPKPPRPSSISKPDFSLRYDGSASVSGSGTSTLSSTNSMSIANSSHATGLTRASSDSTDVPMMRPESPYQGPSGPSHPYQSYPQESRLARTASVTTTSTVPVIETSYAGPSRPTHPYGMYPNTVPEAEDVTPAPIAAGFPGRNTNYQRRLGPEGEEIGGMIGEDGHTEELPPYTQYDEAMARKARPMVQLPGAGGIGLATRNPEFASQDDLNSPHSRQSTRSLVSDNSHHQVNVAAMGVSEKKELKPWQQFAKRKICGVVPYWAVALLVLAVIIFVIILGCTLAVLKPKHHGGNPNSSPAPKTVLTTLTTTFDARPYATPPTSLSPLPTGVYTLPIATATAAPASCLDTVQSSAWSCQIPNALPYEVNITQIAASGDVLANQQISLSLGDYNMNTLPFGAQPPTFSGTKTMRLVNDSYNTDLGPAWWFQAIYDKVVVIPGPALKNNGGANQKRDSDSLRRKSVAEPGDNPWVCFWNNTVLEAFVYVEKESSAGMHTVATTSLSSPTSTSSLGSVQTNVNFTPGYPRVIKVEERRTVVGAELAPAYCVQYHVQANGYAPRLDANGQQITITLNETQSTSDPQSLLSSRGDIPDILPQPESWLAARDTIDFCGCVWIYD